MRQGLHNEEKLVYYKYKDFELLHTLEETRSIIRTSCTSPSRRYPNK